MEKGKRGSGRIFSTMKKQLKQSALNGNGDVGISVKSKKDKTRGSKVNLSNGDCEMGGASEGEAEEQLLISPRSKTNSKRFKLQSKSFKDSNVVAHVSVPRKLRSAMNKRSRESLSPPPFPVAKKLHHTSNGIELSQVSSGKKSRHSMKQGEDRDRSPKEAFFAIPITKDEEEVVETLFSLARMLENHEPVDSKVDERASDEKPSPLREMTDSPLLAPEAPKEESIPSQHACPAAEAINLSSSLEGSAENANKISPLSETTVIDHPTVSENHKLDSSSTVLTNHAKNSVPLTIVPVDDISFASTPKLQASFETSHGSADRPIELSNHEASLPEQKLENGSLPVVNVMKKEEQQPIKEKSTLLTGIEGLSLSPGMSMVPSCGSEAHGPSTRPFSKKGLAWLDSASTRPGSAATSVSTEKVPPYMVERKQSWKKSLTHVYISRLIQGYRTVETKARWPVPPSQLKPNEVTKLGVAKTSDLTESRSGLNGVVSVGSVNVPNRYVSLGGTSGSAASALGKNQNEEQTGVVQGKMLQRDHLASTTSGIYSSDKQDFNFLSLSTGGGGGGGGFGLEPVATSNHNNQGATGMESSAQYHAPYLHPNFQHHPLMSFSLPHIRYPSSQLQLPQYMGSSLYCPPHPGHVGSAKQQQQQHQMWAAQLSAQYRAGGISGSHFPKWQNGRYEPSSLLPCSQPSHSSSSSVEVLGTRFSPACQQQQMFALSSSSTSRGKRQHHPFPPGGFSDGSSGGVFRSDDSPQLQLVCNTQQ